MSEYTSALDEDPRTLPIDVQKKILAAAYLLGKSSDVKSCNHNENRVVQDELDALAYGYDDCLSDRYVDQRDDAISKSISDNHELLMSGYSPPSVNELARLTDTLGKGFVSGTSSSDDDDNNIEDEMDDKPLIPPNTESIPKAKQSIFPRPRLAKVSSARRYNKLPKKKFEFNQITNDESIYNNKKETITIGTPTRSQVSSKSDSDYKRTIPLLRRLSSFSKWRRQNKNSSSLLPYHQQNNNTPDTEEEKTHEMTHIDVSLIFEPSNGNVENETDIYHQNDDSTPPPISPPSPPMSPDRYDLAQALNCSGHQGQVFSPQAVTKSQNKSRKCTDIVSVEFADLESEIELIMGNQ